MTGDLAPEASAPEAGTLEPSAPPAETDVDAARARLEASRVAEISTYAPAYQGLGAHLRDNGVQPDLGNAAIQWAEANFGRPAAPQEARHNYDFSRFNFGPEAQAHLDGFGNAMRKAGASQEQVEVMLQTYEKARLHEAAKHADISREAEKYDQEDVRKAERVLRTEWGEEYAVNLRLVRQYVKSLPAAEREALEAERDHEGTLALNDPDRLRELAERARGAGRTAGQSPAEELAAIRHVMRSDPRSYYRDEAMQARYRDLIRGKAGAGGQTPTVSGAPAEQLARLRKMMGNPNSEYWRGPNAAANQRRYRELLT